jgi:uncharacterized integral membrane protein
MSSTMPPGDEPEAFAASQPGATVPAAPGASAAPGAPEPGGQQPGSRPPGAPTGPVRGASPAGGSGPAGSAAPGPIAARSGPSGSSAVAPDRSPASEPAEGSTASGPADGSPAPTDVNPPLVTGTRTSAVYAGVGVGLLVLVLVIIFIAQNLHKVEVHFLPFHFRLATGLVILASAVAGGIIVLLVSLARVLQIRRGAKRHSSAHGER